MLCDGCGAQNKDGGRFCSDCGKPLGLSPDEFELVDDDAPSAPRASGRLLSPAKAVKPAGTTTTAVECANCGASISIPDGALAVTCEFCGSHLSIERSEGRVYSEIRGQLDEIKAGVDDVRRGSAQVSQASERFADELRLTRIRQEVEEIRSQIGLKSGRLTGMCSVAKNANEPLLAQIDTLLAQMPQLAADGRRIQMGALAVTAVFVLLALAVPLPIGWLIGAVLLLAASYYS